MYGHSFCIVTTITGIVYLNMLQEFLVPHLDEDDQEGRIHFQQVGSSRHYLGEVREYLNASLPGRWIGRAAPIARPLRSPDLIHLDFFLGGFLTNRGLVLFLLANIVEFQSQINSAVAEVTM
jgi:hypothetical protein